MARSGRVKVWIDAESADLVRETNKAERSLRGLGAAGARAGTAASTGMARATRSARAFSLAGKGAAATASRIGTAASTAAPYLIGGLALGLGKAVIEAREAAKVGAQTDAVIKSMGGSANVTAKQVGNLASAISLKTGIDDEAIQSTENLLLTFKNIRNEAGAGNKIFDQTTRTVTDMSVALGQDAKSSAIQLGKALNDPSVGLSALRRVGVSFNEQQTEQIQKMFESGQQMKAQRTILKELTAEFGGSAKAQADSFDKLQVAGENFAESVGRKVTPVLSEMADEITAIFSDKKLSGEQRLERVGDFFEKWGTKAIKGLEGAAPEIAETMAKLAGKAAAAFGRAFLEADMLGKLFLGGLFIRALGGRGVFGRIGGTIGKAMGARIATTVAVETAAGSTVGSAAGSYRKAGKGAGRIFGGAFAAAVVLFLPDLAKKIQEILPGNLGEEGDENLLESLTGWDPFEGAREAIGLEPDNAKAQRKANQEQIREERRKWQAVKRENAEGWQRVHALGLEGHATQERQHKRSGQEIRQRTRVTWGDVVHESKAGSARASKAHEHLRDKGVRATDQLALGVARNIASLVSAVSGGIGIIGEDTNKALRAFGVKPLKFALSGNIGGALGSLAGAAAGALADGRAAGGRIPGYSTVDNHLIAVRGGERVLTPETQFPLADFAMRATYGRGLDQMLAATGGKMAVGGRVAHPAMAGVAKFAAGGVTGDTDFVPGLGTALSRMSKATGTSIFVQSGRRSLAEQASLYSQYLAGTGNLAAPPNPNAPHVRGIAADITPGRERFGTVAGRFGLGFTVPSESWHIELLGAAGSAAQAGRVPLRLVKELTLRGPRGTLRELGQAALDRTRSGANAYLRRKHGYGGGGRVGGTGLGLGGKPVLNVDEITTLAAKHGLPNPSLMAAIAMAESSGNVSIAGDGGDSIGLWQINTPAWPQFSAAKLADPNYNAKAAKIVAAEQGLGAWSVYNSGSYRQFLGGQVLRGDRGGGGRQRGGRSRGGRGGRETTLTVGKATLVDQPLTFADKLTQLDIAASDAEMTADTADDQAVMGQRLGLLQKRRRRLERKLKKGGLGSERRSELLGELASVASEIASLSTSISEFSDGTTDLAAALAENTQAQNDLKEEMAANRRLVEQTGRVDQRSVLGAMAALLSGELGGRIVAASHTASFGAAVRS